MCMTEPSEYELRLLALLNHDMVVGFGGGVYHKGLTHWRRRPPVAVVSEACVRSMEDRGLVALVGMAFYITDAGRGALFEVERGKGRS